MNSSKSLAELIGINSDIRLSIVNLIDLLGEIDESSDDDSGIYNTGDTTLELHRLKPQNQYRLAVAGTEFKIERTDNGIRIFIDQKSNVEIFRRNNKFYFLKNSGSSSSGGIVSL